MKDDGLITVYFGGEARELWTDDGLSVTYSGRLPILAGRGRDGAWRAKVPEPARGENVKQDYNRAVQARELASRLNSGAVARLTAAYFGAAADVGEAVPRCAGDIAKLPSVLSRRLSGRLDAVILPETLRVLLDDFGLTWERAAALLAECFTLAPDAAFSASAAPPIALGALAALQPRDAKLVGAVNEKLCERLWETFPGDWQRIGSAAVVRDGEADLLRLAAALCGRILCTKEQRAGVFRTLYTAMPARFEAL